MKKGNKIISIFVLAGMILSAASALAGEIRIGITMRMVSENGQKYGQMVMDEIDLINKAGGINGNQIKATLMNDECKSDRITLLTFDNEFLRGCERKICGRKHRHEDRLHLCCRCRITKRL